jgi:hypothetical protein
MLIFSNIPCLPEQKFKKRPCPIMGLGKITENRTK